MDREPIAIDVDVRMYPWLPSRVYGWLASDGRWEWWLTRTGAESYDSSNLLLSAGTCPAGFSVRRLRRVP